jgi:hypothetical protein
LTFEKLPVNGEEQLAFSYALPLGEVDALDLPGNARFHLDAVDRLDVSNG